MKKILIVVFCFITTLYVPAQTFQWANVAGAKRSVYPTSAYDDRVKNICSDSKGNAYVAIMMDGYSDVMFGDTAVVAPRARGICSALLCYDCHGILQWYKFFYSNTSTSGHPVANIHSIELIQDTLLLVKIFRYIYDGLFVVNERRELDTVDINVKIDGPMLLWINTNTQEITRIEQGWDGGEKLTEDRMYLKSIEDSIETISVYALDSSLTLLHRTTLDLSEVREENVSRIQMYWTPYHNKYYMLIWSTCPLVIGGDTMPHKDYSYVACFDSSGTNLWYRLWGKESWYLAGNIEFDEETNTLYVVHEHRFAAFDTLGNCLFERRITNNPRSTDYLWGMKVIPNNRVVLGGKVLSSVVSMGGGG